jgi:hypothetical protein
MKRKPAKVLKVCSECAERKKMLFDAGNRNIELANRLKLSQGFLSDAQAQFQQADEALRTELLRTACLREEIERLTDERDNARS